MDKNMTQFAVTNAVGTQGQIAELTERAISTARVTGSIGATVWLHDLDDASEIAPTVTVKRIDE